MGWQPSFESSFWYVVPFDHHAADRSNIARPVCEVKGFVTKKTVAISRSALYHAGVIKPAGPVCGIASDKPQRVVASRVTGYIAYAGQGTRTVQKVVLEYL